jgi:hypothetical protein
MLSRKLSITVAMAGTALFGFYFSSCCTGGNNTTFNKERACY